MGPPAVPPPSHSSARSRASLKEAGAREADGTRSCGGGTAAQGRPITRPRGCVPPKRPPKRECASATAYDLKLTEGWLPSARARSCGGGGGAAASSRRRRLEGASEDTELVGRGHELLIPSGCARSDGAIRYLEAIVAGAGRTATISAAALKLISSDGIRVINCYGSELANSAYTFHERYALYYFDETRYFFLPAWLLCGTGRCSCMDDGLVRSRLENLAVCR